MNNFYQNGAGAFAMLNSSLNNLTSTVGNSRQMKRQHKYNKELMSLEQEWQLRMWRMANEYNLPINEIQRLMDAGINPAVAFSNGGASAAPIPAPPVHDAGVLPSPNLSNPVLAGVQAEATQAQVELAESQAAKNYAEADAANSSSDLSRSVTTLNEFEAKIKGDPSYIDALRSNPVIRNSLMILERDISSLEYSFDLATYGNRLTLSNIDVGLANKELSISDAKLKNIKAQYRVLGAQVRRLDAGSEVDRAQAAVLRQTLDVRAGQALIGTIQADVIRYCQKHGIKDSVTEEIRPFLAALADRYAAEVDAGIYSSHSLAEVSYQDDIYQHKHGQERRALETTEIQRRANWYRTNQWTQSINCASQFIGTVVDAVGTVVTRGMSKVGSSLVTPSSGSTPMLSPDARNVLREVYKSSRDRLLYE